MDDEKRLSELMVAYQAGEAAAFEELYRLTRPRLHQFLVIKTLDRARAEDLLQETYLQVHRSRRTYLPGRPVVPWIYAIARHVCLTDHRRRLVRRHREVAIVDQDSDFPVPPEGEQNIGSKELWKALSSLPEQQREVILLYHYWGFSFKEVGSILNIRSGTAKVRAHRAVSNLRKHLRPAVTGVV